MFKKKGTMQRYKKIEHLKKLNDELLTITPDPLDLEEQQEWTKILFLKNEKNNKNNNNKIN
jgi:hypothetical protein